MAFCTSCGAQLDATSQFCVKCGTKQAAGVGGGGAAAARAAAPSQATSSAVKIVLIVVAGIVLLGVVGSVVGLLIVRRIARETKVAISESKGEARVVTPFGTVETTKDPAKIAEKLDVDIYPGAKATEGGSDVQAMGMHTVTGIFETSDPAEKVGEFYRQRYPKGMYTASGSEHTLVVGGKGSMITIHIQDEGGKTKITIANIIGKGMGAN
jgi:hypothetical protein